MIIEEEQKVEIVDDTTKKENTQEFKQIPNNSEKASKHWIMAICIFLISFLIFIIELIIITITANTAIK